MGATNYALRINTPTQVTTKTTTTTAAPTAVSISDWARVWVKGTEEARIRFGTSSVGSPTAGDVLLTADADYVFDVTPDVTHARIRRIGSTDTTVIFARVG